MKVELKAKSVFGLIADISVLEIKKALCDVEASAVVQEIKRRGIPVEELVILPSSRDDKGRRLSNVLAPVFHDLPPPNVLRLYHSFALDDAFSNGLGNLRRLELGAEIQVDSYETLKLPPTLQELLITTQLEAENPSIAFLPLLAQLAQLRVLQISGVVFAMENENTFTSFVKVISREHMPLLAVLEFTDCQFRQSYIPRRTGQPKCPNVRRLGFLDRRGKFGRNHGFVRIMATEISPVAPVLEIDLDLDELELFWRQTLGLLAQRSISLELGVEERSAKRRPTYPVPPPAFGAVLTRLTLSHFSDPYLLENFWRFTFYPRLRALSFLASQLSDRCLALVCEKCAALEELKVAEDHRPTLLNDVLSPLIRTWDTRRSARLLVCLDFAEAFQWCVEVPMREFDFPKARLRSQYQVASHWLLQPSRLLGSPSE